MSIIWLVSASLLKKWISLRPVFAGLNLIYVRIIDNFEDHVQLAEGATLYTQYFGAPNLL